MPKNPKAKLNAPAPFFGLLALALILIFVPVVSRAQNEVLKKTTTTTVTTSTKEINGEPEVPPYGGNHIEKDFLVSKTFGSKAQSGMTGCKTEELSDQYVKDLEGQCNEWITVQKRELKSKYQTGTCEESCSDCGMTLKRCTVLGAVHYAK